MDETNWYRRLLRLFRKDAQPAPGGERLVGHPFRTAPVLRDEPNASLTEPADKDLPPSLRSLLEKKRGNAP